MTQQKVIQSEARLIHLQTIAADAAQPYEWWGISLISSPGSLSLSIQSMFIITNLVIIIIYKFMIMDLMK